MQEIEKSRNLNKVVNKKKKWKLENVGNENK